ncbi:EAL domain-containing protein [Actinoplanes sp. TBRC 11911]|uniref:putative bifunctional diguanylate cyclase/phosphodiesterase n=1 Tax=Actinoplanes sp. TBRC 11911 TaxID=2729386 RepID=UPI00145CE5C5|nr:EAL domain-containing protein [Actinoplanes sp. TBRC 11911]NMO51334.1 EAL domain-containing protein [Actinoplanes sp. TBRC 11911]
MTALVPGDTGPLIAGTAAAAICFVAARGRAGIPRRWRLFAGAGLAGWAVAHLALPAAVLLVLPACLLLALLQVPYARLRSVPNSPLRDQVALVIDSVLIAGSLLALLCTVLPERVLRPGLAAAYPIADLVLLTMVVLLLLTRPDAPVARVPLRLGGLAVLSFGVADTLRLFELPGAWAGYLLGPLFLALAALSRPGVAGETEVPAERDWLHLLLPYVPVTATGVVIAISTGPGRHPLSPFEAYLGWLGLGLVVARQMFTIVDNTVLLDRVSEGQRRLHHQAYHDPLTGLANRALFRERLVAAIEAQRPVAVLFADLDDFKLINDSYGHAMGDRVLHAIADRLRGCVAPDDMVARLGGDEFAVVLDHRPGDAEPVGLRMLAALGKPFLIDGHSIRVGASIGLVVPEPGEQLSADALLRRADAAMYAGKRRGKGAMARYAGGNDGDSNADLPHLLAQALSGGGDPRAAGFEVHYQPIVRLSDGQTTAVEALARWTSPVAGPVHPDVFVTVAERSGLVGAIDDFVLDQACADAGALAAGYGRPIDVHVNVSAARLGQDGLFEGISAALTRHGVPASRLVVEITETRRIPDLTGAAEVAGRLRSLGVRVALDDFGSGFNALVQLHSLPVDIVKLDAKLTDVDVAPERAAALCRSVLAICEDLNITVVAEGIETATRAAAMAEVGCPLGQGYLFGQPGPLPPFVPPQPTDLDSVHTG